MLIFKLLASSKKDCTQSGKRLFLMSGIIISVILIVIMFYPNGKSDPYEEYQTKFNDFITADKKIVVDERMALDRFISENDLENDKAVQTGLPVAYRCQSLQSLVLWGYNADRA